MDENKTYGQKIAQHLDQKHALEDDVIEYRRTMEKRVLLDIKNVAEQACKSPHYGTQDFYIVLLMKVEHIGQAPRTYVFARKSCPTPTYKQSVWKYHRESGSLEFLWSIPDKILYYHIVNNATKYLIDKETSQLTKYVLLMESGELVAWVKKENGELPDALIQIKEQEGT